MKQLKISNSYYTPRVGSLDYYLKEIADFKNIDEKIVRSLIKKSKNGDVESKHKIVKAHQKFVVTVAKKFYNGNFELLCDLINEGNIGLIESIDTFNHSFENKFITHAVHQIQKRIYSYLTNSNSTIRTKIPQIVITRTKHINNKFMLCNGRYPSTDEIVDILYNEYDIYMKDEANVYNVDFVSLNYSDEDSEGNENENQYSNIPALISFSDYEEQTENDYKKTILNEAMGILTEDEKQIINMLYGFNQFKELEVQQVSDRLGISGDAVRSIKKKALRKLEQKIYNTINVI